MGKTEDGAIWLSEEKLDVNQFWQFGEIHQIKMLLISCIYLQIEDQRLKNSKTEAQIK